MSLLPNKSGLLIGSIVGSIVGLLFASETGKSLRTRLTGATTPQKKFEVIFQEYLKVGNAVFKEVESHESVREIIAGGRDVLAELKKRATKEGGQAVKFAERKTSEILAEAEKLVSKASAATKKTVAKAERTVGKTVTRAKQTITKAEKTAKKTVSKARTTAKKAVVKAKKKLH